jgi:CMP-N-acetylneuraminic acid synthetase/spore coat polysaccharide biosynthesis predicted glycosyltransferase SpsG
LIGERRVIAVVPARGGDAEVPYLNIKKLGPLPLIAYTLNEARKSAYIDRLVVSTDDDQVAEVATEYGASAPFRRPQELSGDIPEIKAVIRHAVHFIEDTEGERYDIVITLQATSPFRTAEQIDEAIERLVEDDLDAVISLKETRNLTWRREHDRLVPMFTHAVRREDLKPLFEEDGAIRVVRRDVLESKERLGSRVGHVLMDKMSALTVHDIYDFWLAEKLVRLPRVLFRVDGDKEIGMGHVYRSLAVAGALREAVPHSDVCFLMKAEHPEAVQHVSRAGYAVRVIPATTVRNELETIRDYSPNVVVNDLPKLTVDYLRDLSLLGASTMNLVDSLEDIEDPKAIASIIVATVQEDQSDLEEYYGGPAFAILRKSFEERRPARHEVNEVSESASRIVLSFGGADPQGITLVALEALDPLVAASPDLGVTVVLGPAFGYGEELESLLPRLSRPPTIVKNVEHMADLLFDADLVLCSGGMTVFEIAALGRPGIVLTQNAREKKRMESFERYGTIVHLGFGREVSAETLRGEVSSLLCDSDRRRAMSEAGAALVDADWASRITPVMREAGKRGPANGGRWL